MKLGRDVFVALASVAWADGKVAPEEAEALCGAARACGLEGADLDAVVAATERPVGLDEVALLRLEDGEKTFVYAIACWLACADGQVVEAERASLRQLGELLDLDAEERGVARAAAVLTAEMTGGTDIAALAEQIEAMVDEVRA
jgi:uncharacterized tellurite resistance protein B-like protein